MLEWVEIYNQADTAINLNKYIFISGIDTTVFPPGAYIPPQKYAVLAKRPVVKDSLDSFEGHWGDSSGYWGDSPLENYRVFPAQMTLSNSAGIVFFIDTANGAMDQCIWNGPASDGQSLERDVISPPSESWHLCSDPSGSTPGRSNSEGQMPVTREILILSSRMISSARGDALSIDYGVPAGCQIALEIYDDSGHRQAVLVEKSFLSGRISWNGRGANGTKLPPGVYMLLATLTGIQSDTKCIPVVIAP